MTEIVASFHCAALVAQQQAPHTPSQKHCFLRHHPLSVSCLLCPPLFLYLHFLPLPFLLLPLPVLCLPWPIPLLYLPLPLLPFPLPLPGGLVVPTVSPSSSQSGRRLLLCFSSLTQWLSAHSESCCRGRKKSDLGLYTGIKVLPNRKWPQVYSVTFML